MLLKGGMETMVSKIEKVEIPEALHNNRDKGTRWEK